MTKIISILIGCFTFLICSAAFAQNQSVNIGISRCEAVNCPEGTSEEDCKKGLDCPKGVNILCLPDPIHHQLTCFCAYIERETMQSLQQSLELNIEEGTPSCNQVVCPEKVDPKKCSLALKCLPGFKPICEKEIRDGKKVWVCRCEDRRQHLEY